MLPGGKGPYCNDSCGNHRYYLKKRSCTPTRLNLPRGYSCETLDGSLTLDSSETACEPYVPCKGNLNVILRLHNIWPDFNFLDDFCL